MIHFIRLMLIILTTCLLSLTGGRGSTVLAQTSAPAPVRPTFEAGVSLEAQRQPGVVGLDLRILPRAYPVVAAVVPGTPASRLGLRPGDIIVEIDGADTYGLSRQAVDVAISDRPGDVVRLVIARGQRILPYLRLTVAALSQLPDGARPYFIKPN